MKDWKATYGKKLRSFLKEIFDWSPDYIVPVGRKCAKLFRIVDLPDNFYRRVYYKEHFDFLGIPIANKKIAIIDDSVRHGSALRHYRDHLMEKNPREIQTFAFVGHMGLKDGTHITYEPKMRVKIFLSEPAYQDYLIEQAEFLLNEGFYQDVHHLVLEIDLGPAKDGIGNELFSCLEKTGYTYPIAPFRVKPMRFSVVDPGFFLKLSSLHPKGTFFEGINKLRFHIGEHGRIILVPMVLPHLRNEKECAMPEWETPFKLPCQIIRSTKNHSMDKLCYWSSSLLLSAELGRTFLLFLKSKSEDFPGLVDVLDQLEVRDVDFIRYLGENLAKDLASAIKQFLLLPEYKPPRNLMVKLDAALYKKKDVTYGTLTKWSEASILDHLRTGYDKEVETAGTRVGVHYSLPLDALEKVGNAHPMLLMEILDSFCDVGILVPVVDPSKHPLERRWRTGEPEYDIDWKRNSFLIPLAIQTTRDEIGKKEVGAMLLTKILANFAYDYPKRLPFCRLHCLERDPYIDGTLVRIYHPIRAKIPVSVYDFRKAGNRYKYKKAEGTRRGYFYTAANVLDDKDFDGMFGNDQRIPIDEIIAYFSFLSNLSEKFGNVDVLTALSICRSRDTFLEHLYENLRLCAKDYGLFIETLSLPYSEDIQEGPLHRSGHDVDAGLRKIWYWRGFDDLLKEIVSKTAEVRFQMPLRKLLANIEDNPQRNLPVLIEYESLLSLQQALTGITIAKLMPQTLKTRTPEEIEKWASKIFEENDVTFDLEKWEQASNVQSFREIIEPIYYEIYQRVKGLFREFDEEAERERRMFKRAARNRAVEIIRNTRWKNPAFVHLDLSGFRTAGDRAPELIRNLYEVAEDYCSKLGGQCVTPEPGGNDYLLYVFPKTIVALRMTATCLSDYESKGIPVKFGIAGTEVVPGQEFESIIAKMGLCKDLCEFESPQYRNIKDALVTVKLVERISNSVGNEYFEEVAGETIAYASPKGKHKSKVFKFRWKKFLEDRR